MTAQLLTEQGTPGSSTGRNGDHAAKANPNACPECGEVAPAHTAACSIGKSMLPAAAMSAAAEAKPQAVSPVHPPQSRVGAELPESPYSWNLHAEAKDGWDEQFTIRASDSHAFIEKIEGLKKYLGERGYKPATRGAGRGRAPENTGADGEEAPICAIHHKAMIKVQGKKGAFWSCHEKLEDGSYCPFKPASK